MGIICCYCEYNEIIELKISDNRYKEECCICLDILGKQKCQELECGHIFHYSCIEKWTYRSETCPICRIEI